jgi:hypothetical protein
MKEYTVKVFDDGTKSWWLNGKFHREDGPAYEDADGTKAWWLNGVRHREDGPAYENASGYKEWWVHGKMHREDGPAAEHANGAKYWFLHDKQLTEQEFNDRNKPVELTLEQIAEKFGISADKLRIKE